MRKLLLQLDSSPLPSVFDRVVAYDAGADEVMSYGGVTDAAVRDLVHGAIFTRGPKDLHNTAIFIGGADMAAGERLLAVAQKALFGQFRVSLMLDSNGSNTTAVAAVAKLMQTTGDIRGRRVVITAGTGPVGTRAAALLAKAGADVVITSRHLDDAERLAAMIAGRFGVQVRPVAMPDRSQTRETLAGAAFVLNAGPAGVTVVPRDAWANCQGLEVVVDLNAVPPRGVEGIELSDNGEVRDGVATFGAIAVGNLKMKIHKRCIARLFERNDLVLDVETIAEVAREFTEKQG